MTIYPLIRDHGLLGGLDDNDHGAIYYTEAEVDALFGAYLELDGETTDVTNGTFDLTTTGTLTSTGGIFSVDAIPGAGDSVVNQLVCLTTDGELYLRFT